MVAVPVMAVPVTVVVAPTPVTVPMAPVTMVMPVSPAHLLRLEAVDLVLAGDGGLRIGISRRQPPVVLKRLRQQRRGLRARRQRNSARGKSNGEFQKVAAFHDISLLVACVCRVMPGDFDRAEMNGR